MVSQKFIERRGNITVESIRILFSKSLVENIIPEQWQNSLIIVLHIKEKNCKSATCLPTV